MSRAFAFTWNNYESKETALEHLRSVQNVVGLIVGCEIAPETGTPHLQGYLAFGKVMTLYRLRELLPGCHVEVCRNREASKNYCRKGGDMLVDEDNEAGQGSRSDLKRLREALDAGGIAEAKKVCPETLIKYSGGAKFYVSIVADSVNRDVLVVAYIGPPGCGKTRAANSQCLDGNGFMLTLPQPNQPVWFDGYAGESVLVLDEFTGQIQFQFLMRLLDRYALKNLPIKGGTTQAHWSKVIITSNSEWGRWYSDQPLGALSRRLGFDESKPHGERGDLKVYHSEPWDLGVLQY